LTRELIIILCTAVSGLFIFQLINRIASHTDNQGHPRKKSFLSAVQLATGIIHCTMNPEQKSSEPEIKVISLTLKLALSRIKLCYFYGCAIF